MSSTSQFIEPNDVHNFDLFTATSLGNLNSVDKILRNNSGDVNGVNESGWTPLMYASHYGHYSVIRLLIQYNCDVNLREKVQGRTALMLAASNGHSRSIEVLINYGKADKNLKDFKGHDVKYYAKTCGHGNNKLIKSLLENGYELKGRSFSSFSNSTDIPNVQINNSSDISETPKRFELSEKTVFYNPNEQQNHSSDHFYSTKISAIWTPLSQNPFESQSNLLSDQMVSKSLPSVFELTPPDSSCASTPSDPLCGSHMKLKPISGRNNTFSINIPIHPVMPSTLFHLLTAIELIQYLDVFENNAIDFYSFLTLTDNDFQALGITYYGHRKKLSIAQSRYHETLDICNTHESFLADYLLNERNILNNKIQVLEEKIKYYERID